MIKNTLVVVQGYLFCLFATLSHLKIGILDKEIVQ